MTTSYNWSASTRSTRSSSNRPGRSGTYGPAPLILGARTSIRSIRRPVELAGLTPRAIAELAGLGGMDAGELHRRTGGSPFYVTEVLAADAGTMPRSVRDAVLARAARLRGMARDLLDVASVVPGPVETWLLDALAPTAAKLLDECLATGMLVLAGDRVEFRHEIARQVVEESMPPGRRRAMHRAALATLTSPAAGQQDPARLVHHADAAGDAQAVLEYAPAAAAQAAAAGGRREAARLYARALRFADMPEPDRQAALLEGFADAAYFTELSGEATEALRKAVAIHRERGDHVRQGDASPPPRQSARQGRRRRPSPRRRSRRRWPCWSGSRRAWSWPARTTRWRRSRGYSTTTRPSCGARRRSACSRAGWLPRRGRRNPEHRGDR